MRQTCTPGILKIKCKNKLAVEVSEGAIIQDEAAKELRQGSVRESHQGNTAPV